MKTLKSKIAFLQKNVLQNTEAHSGTSSFNNM